MRRLRLLILTAFAASTGCYAAHVRPDVDEDAAPIVDAAVDVGSGTVCPGAILELHVPDDGCAAFVIPDGTPALPPSQTACLDTTEPDPSRPVPGYHIRVLSSGHVGLVVTVDRNPPCPSPGPDCLTAFSRLLPGAGCVPEGCTFGEPGPARLPGAPTAVTELFVWPFEPAEGLLQGSVCAVSP